MKRIATFVVGIVVLASCREATGPRAVDPDDAPALPLSGPVCVPAPSGLVSWWPADGNAADIVGENDGTLQGNVTFTMGKVGQTFSFDGTGFVSIPDSPTLDLTNEITLEFWFNYSDVTGFRGLIAKRGFGQTNYGVNTNSTFLGFGLYYDDPTVTGGDDFDAVGSPFEASRLLPVPAPDQFHHFAGTYRQVDPTQIELKMFIDGQLAKTLSLPGNLSNTLNNVPVTIGASFAAFELFKGLLDELTIYNRALSDSEIKAIFDAGSAGKCRFIEFAAFDIERAELELGPGPDDDEFEVEGSFTLGSASNGIDPRSEVVTLEVGTFTTTIPVGSFELNNSGEFGEFEFKGVIGGVTLEFEIRIDEDNSFEFEVEGEGADLTGAVNPVEVTLTIGDDTGTTSVTAAIEDDG